MEQAAVFRGTSGNVSGSIPGVQIYEIAQALPNCIKWLYRV